MKCLDFILLVKNKNLFTVATPAPDALDIKIQDPYKPPTPHRIELHNDAEEINSNVLPGRLKTLPANTVIPKKGRKK